MYFLYLIHDGAVNTGQGEHAIHISLVCTNGLSDAGDLSTTGEIKKAPISSRLKPVFLTASSFARVAAASMAYINPARYPEARETDLN